MHAHPVEKERKSQKASMNEGQVQDKTTSAVADGLAD
jgi:hypothetical protein